MERLKVAAFGAAEKGKFSYPYHIKSLSELHDELGNPPPETLGLECAIQVILSNKDLIYFRVKEEGVSKKCYLKSLKALEKVDRIYPLHALCLPGMGDREVLEVSTQICHVYNSILIVGERDLYDYLTA